MKKASKKKPATKKKTAKPAGKKVAKSAKKPAKSTKKVAKPAKPAKPTPAASTAPPPMRIGPDRQATASETAGRSRERHVSLY